MDESNVITEPAKKVEAQPVDAKRERELIEESEANKKRFDAEMAKRLAHDTALQSLSASDYQIIRAMERKLAAEGLLDADLVKAREEARAVVKVERGKL